MSNDDNKAEIKCVLCGKMVPFMTEKAVIGATGKVVCGNCIKPAVAVGEITAEAKHQEKIKKTEIRYTPLSIVEHLDKAIISQHDAKKAVALAIWKQLVVASGENNIPKSHLLIYGPTGCGKTAIVRECAKYVNLPFMIVDSTAITQNGYKGKDPVEVLDDYLDKYRDNPMVQHGIIFLDEFDKLAAKGEYSQAAYLRAAQHGLLKLVEGELTPTKYKSFPTDNLLYIFGGAFSGIHNKKRTTYQPIGFESHHRCDVSERHKITTDDFVDYGIEPEMIGRIGRAVALNPLSEEDLRKIILYSNLSVYKKYQQFFAGNGERFELAEEQIQYIISDAFSRGTGARAINSIIEEIVEPLLLQVANQKKSEGKYE